MVVTDENWFKVMTDSSITSLPGLKETEQQAAEWIMRLEDGDVSAEDRASFQAWYDKDEQNKDAMQRLSQLWDGLDVLAEFNDYAAVDDTVVPLKQHRVWRNAFTRRSLVRGLAASVAAVCCAISYQVFFATGKGFESAYQTAVGEQETIELPDGSSIVLNTNSAIDVEFSRTARNIRLTKGEAFFDVASDEKKPFAVRAGNGVVTAVGTAFTVRLHNEKLDLVVTQGRVELEALSELVKPDGGASSSTRPVTEVAAGQAAIFDHKVERLDRIEPAALEKKLDWRDGVLAFNGEPLEQVIADISRYTEMSIEIRGEELRRLPIAGYFKIGEIDALLDALKTMAGIEVERVSNRKLLLYRL